MVDSFEGGDVLEKVILKNLKTCELIPVTVDTCFLFIGYIPNTDIFKGLVDMTKRGYIKTNEDMETNVPGVFAVGDCRDKTLRQVATAVGDGAIAGYMVEKYVEEVNYVQSEILNAQGLLAAYIYNAIETADCEYLTKMEAIQKKMNNAFHLRRIDVYKSDQIAKRLEYTKAPSVILLKDGKVLENITDLSDLETKFVDVVSKYS